MYFSGVISSTSNANSTNSKQTFTKNIYAFLDPIMYFNIQAKYIISLNNCEFEVKYEIKYDETNINFVIFQKKYTL